MNKISFLSWFCIFIVILFFLGRYISNSNAEYIDNQVKNGKMVKVGATHYNVMEINGCEYIYNYGHLGTCKNLIHGMK